MRNIKAEVKSGKLTIVVDLSEKGQPSASGKTMVVATTSGFASIGDGFKYGLNVIKAK